MRIMLAFKLRVYESPHSISSSYRPADAPAQMSHIPIVKHSHDKGIELKNKPLLTYNLYAYVKKKPIVLIEY